MMRRLLELKREHGWTVGRRIQARQGSLGSSRLTSRGVPDRKQREQYSTALALLDERG